MTTSTTASGRSRGTSPDRSDLLAAAAALLIEHGYRGTSMSDIAKRAGVSVGSLYNFAPSKSALILDVFREYDRRQSDRVADAVAAARSAGSDSPIDLFAAGTYGYLSGAWRERALSAVLSNLDARDVDLPTLRSLQSLWLDRNARALGLSDDSPRSHALAEGITGALGGWSRGVQLCPDDAAAAAYISEAVGALRIILAAAVLDQTDS